MLTRAVEIDVQGAGGRLSGTIRIEAADATLGGLLETMYGATAAGAHELLNGLTPQTLAVATMREDAGKLKRVAATNVRTSLAGYLTREIEIAAADFQQAHRDRVEAQGAGWVGKRDRAAVAMKQALARLGAAALLGLQEIKS